MKLNKLTETIGGAWVWFNTFLPGILFLTALAFICYAVFQVDRVGGLIAVGLSFGLVAVILGSERGRG